MSDMPRFYRLPDVIKLVGLSKTTNYRLELQGKFPTRVHPTESTVAWRTDELKAWMDDRPRVRNHETENNAQIR